MGVLERRQREREERREQILDAARELFAHEGFDNVTVRRIADRIEYSPGTIYGYFQDKDELLWELCQGGFTSMSQSMVDALDPSTDPLHQLTAIGKAYMRFALDYPEDFQLMFNTKNMNDEFRKRMQQHVAEELTADNAAQEHAYLILRGVVQRCMDAGCLSPGDPDTVAMTFWGMAHGLVSLHVTGKLGMMLQHLAPAELEQRLFQSMDYLITNLKHEHLPTNAA